MKWLLGNCGATYLIYITDTVQTVQYSDSQCTVHVYTQLPPRKLLDLFLIRYLRRPSQSLSTLVLFKSSFAPRLKFGDILVLRRKIEKS